MLSHRMYKNTFVYCWVLYVYLHLNLEAPQSRCQKVIVYMNLYLWFLDLILILYDVLSMYMLFEYTCNPEFCQDFNSLMYLNLNLRNNYGLQQLYSMQKI